MDQNKGTEPRRVGVLLHYYGDAARRFFLAGALLMIVALPIFNDLLPVNAFLSIFTIIFVGFFAGFTNPRQRWVLAMDAVIGIIAFCTFEYYAVDFYVQYAFQNLLFVLNQVLALLFFLGAYYSVKSWRGASVK
ncbi:MAG: hypothetical protein A3B25_03410 [Candidatus Ryanbacteria bacterium RIFCSPLOWO2_01_FULL_48_26]|uniref:Uncharacterized protein n=1 Tax=Candidatus Ryanbacteria bacterium RIFCSPLOWO2_01_FULL_48_26 TaxID=1802126 RepID=A0A1G2GRC3_9BACT|nr:MAG: hypothetical protein A3B25_03410 [Candidatus Ryanbacteria bacterium RIFCSPLOWO2_01_FULL_48_26]